MSKYHLTNRPNREIISSEDIEQLLKQGKYVTIALCRDNEPYIVTLSYGYDENRKALYFHASNKGLKLEFLSTNPLVCATIIEDGGYIKDECAHAYRSVVFWGKMKIVDELEEKRHGMSILVNHLETREATIKELLLKSEDRYYKTMEVLRLDIGEVRGKEGR